MWCGGGGHGVMVVEEATTAWAPLPSRGPPAQPLDTPTILLLGIWGWGGGGWVVDYI